MSGKGGRNGIWEEKGKRERKKRRKDKRKEKD